MPPKKGPRKWTSGNGSGDKGGSKKKVDASVLGLAPAVPMLGGLGGLGGLVGGGGLPVVPGMDLGMAQQMALMSQIGGNNSLNVEMSAMQALQVQAAMAQLQQQQKTNEEEAKQKAIQEGVRRALKKKGLQPATLTDEEREEDEVSEVSGKTTRNAKRKQRLKDAEARVDNLQGENTMLRHTLKHVRDYASKGGPQSDDEGLGGINPRALRKLIRAAESEGRSQSLGGKSHSTQPTPKPTPRKATRYHSLISDSEEEDDVPRSGGGMMAKVKARVKKAKKIDDNVLQDPTTRATALTETLDEVLGKIKAHGGVLEIPNKEDEKIVRPMADKVARVYHDTVGKESVTALIDGMLLGKHGFEKGGLSLARYLCQVLWHITVNEVDLEAHPKFMKLVYKQ